jgi:DNA polymerase I-like protein with 3'-5' exonuclease and polymerase domains
MKFIVLDSESDGLWKDATKIHVLSWTEDGKTFKSTNDYEEMRSLLHSKDAFFVAHNSIRHDLPLFNKVLGTNLNYKTFVDSLALSWYLNESRPKHGLESYGIEFGVLKPKVDDWENLTYEDYKHRCEEDTKINWLLWQDLWGRLKGLYRDEEEAIRLIQYLSFKMDCAREAEETGIRLDVAKAQEHYDTLSRMEEEKVAELAKAMPRKTHYKTVNKPKSMYKKDGSLSEAGKKWLNVLTELKLPHTTVGPVNVVDYVEDGNPGSHQQVKEWLYSLGWKPATYKFVRDKKTGQERSIEQVRVDGELCESVVELAEKDPAVKILEGLTVITHRLGIFKSFLRAHDNGRIYAGIEGITNTFRFKHKDPVVNLPGVDKPWGKEIRGCLLPPEDYVWAGSDMVSLEDNTKRHYMRPLDPKYVEEMMQPGFDPHLNLAAFAGAVTQEQIDQHNEGKINLKPVRKKFKAANYSCVYGVGKAKLARTLDIPVKEAEGLIEAYWRRNWSIKKVSEQQKVKIWESRMWLQNPVSKFWHSLRAEKDIFSTLNQSTGVYCFDTWVGFSRVLGMKLSAQFHDEQLCPVAIGNEETAKTLLKEAIDYTNKKLNLNIDLDVDVQFGSDYASVH